MEVMTQEEKLDFEEFMLDESFKMFKHYENAFKVMGDPADKRLCIVIAGTCLVNFRRHLRRIRNIDKSRCETILGRYPSDDLKRLLGDN